MAVNEKNKKLIIEQYPDTEFMFYDGYDDAIIGVMERFGSELIVCYDKEKVLGILQKDMTREDAIEFYEFNIIGGYNGEKTPSFVDII